MASNNPVMTDPSAGKSGGVDVHNHASNIENDVSLDLLLFFHQAIALIATPHDRDQVNGRRYR
jgi:hypothetical protein